MARAARKPRGLKLEDLAPEIQEEVLEKHRDWQVDDHEWWDCVYEDAKRIGALMGIQIDDINFSGFCSQGDDAAFHGTYQYEPQAIERLRAETNDTDQDLVRIATELTTAQVTLMLEHGDTYRAIVTANDNNLHTGAPIGDDDLSIETWVDIDSVFESLLRDFAMWIYVQLEAEHDYLTSDESVRNCLQDLRFEPDGTRI